jgi:adenosine kinase
MDGDEIQLLVDGAAYLFTNEYEAALTEKKTGWSAGEILERVGTRVTTLGPEGSRVERQGEEPIRVHAVDVARLADPTGVGDAFRAGFLAGVAWGISLERSAQVGSLLAAYVIETVGTQEYELSKSGFLRRFADGYGQPAADEVQPHLVCPRP